MNGVVGPRSCSSWIRLQLAGLCLLASSSCGGPQFLEDLKQPVWWEHSTGPCSFVRALDADGMIWDDRGCEDGRFTLDQVGATSADNRELVWQAVARLPADPGPSPSCTSGARHVFGVQREGVSTHWIACGSSREFRVPTGLSGPFLDLAQALNNLP
jgi:hypothetical protein